MELIAESIRVEREARILVDDFNMTFRPGEIWVVLGPNGSGKSSLVLALAGELAPSQGEFRITGEGISAMGAVRRSACLAWQGDLPRVEFGFTVAERLTLVPVQARRVSEALSRLDLTQLANRRLFELSSGERQRVELAALWLRPAPIWLLDEPTAHLDLRHQVRWLEVLSEEARCGRTIIVVLHDLTQAHAIADHALLLFGDGRSIAGEAKVLLEPERLEDLYRTPIQELVGPNGSELLPVYSTGALPVSTSDQRRRTFQVGGRNG